MPLPLLPPLTKLLVGRHSLSQLLQVLSALFKAHLPTGACDRDSKQIAEMAKKTAKKAAGSSSKAKAKQPKAKQ